MKPVKCSCGSVLRSKKDIGIAFELVYQGTDLNQRPPKVGLKPGKIIFHILCARCGTEIKQIEKEGEEAIELWRKLDKKITASAP